MILERLTTTRGEVVLRRVGEHYEIISNGTFLMDSRDGRSERLLVTAALARCPSPARMLLGGLGIGFSLAAAVADPRVAAVTVVEIEPALVRWHASHLAAYSAGALADSRVKVVVTDLLDYLYGTDERYDAICLDVDNGPDWTVTNSNAALYDGTGTSLLASRLREDGVLSVWSSTQSSTYEDLLRRHLADVSIVEIPVARGDPHVVFLGRRRHIRDGSDARAIAPGSLASGASNVCRTPARQGKTVT